MVLIRVDIIACNRSRAGLLNRETVNLLMGCGLGKHVQIVYVFACECVFALIAPFLSL